MLMSSSSLPKYFLSFWTDFGEDEAPDIDGQSLSLDLHHNALLGTFEGSTGKLYEMISHESQEPEATVFLPPSSDCKIAGKISRQVSILNYPNPRELSKSNRSV